MLWRIGVVWVTSVAAIVYLLALAPTLPWWAGILSSIGLLAIIGWLWVKLWIDHPPRKDKPWL